MLIYFYCQIANTDFIVFLANYLKILPKFESEKDQKCYFVVAQVRWCGKDSLDNDHRRNQLSHANCIGRQIGKLKDT